MSRPSQPPLARAAAAANLAAASLLGLALARKLWPAWTSDPNLSHGFATPIVSLLLLRESRVAGPWRSVPGAAAGAALGTGAAGILGLACLVAAGLFAAAVDWTGALVDFSLTCAFAAFGVAVVCAFADRAVAWVPLNWSSLLAALIWPLSAPIPPGTYTRLTIALQLRMSEGVLTTLHLLGIAAHREGNIIDLSTGSVGVADACSGIRSLVSCVFAGLLLSGTLVHAPARRAVLIGLSAPLALVMNFIRALVLTLLVAHGVDIARGWHDVTGYAVLAVTGCLLAGLALVLGRSHPEPAAPATSTDSATPAPTSPPRPDAGDRCSRLPPAQFVLSALLGMALILTLFFWVQTRPPSAGNAPAPDLEAIVPASADGWTVTTAGNLHDFSGILLTSDLVQRTYTRRDARGVFEITFYLAHWKAGQAPVSLVATHTPDACWPGVGWVVQSQFTSRSPLQVAGRSLPAPEHRLFTRGPLREQVWFWHLNGGRPLVYEDPRSPMALIRIALRYGFNPAGDQLFVRVSSNRPWEDLSAEPLVTGLLQGLRPLGL